MQCGGATVLSVLGLAPGDEDGFGARMFSKLDRWSWCRVRLRLTVKRFECVFGLERVSGLLTRPLPTRSPSTDSGRGC